MARTWGRYELLLPLAKGGMAEVFLARRRGPAGVDKRVVIKRIRPERAGDPRLLQLFVREARLSMSLAHENIVPVFDFGRIGDELFLAMEHVAGRDLDAALTRARARAEPLDPVVVAHIGVEACQALDYAHRKRDEGGKPLGVVHRDITPRNVLLSFSGEVKLVDFGVARLGGDEERVGRLRGTPGYMAPEQARGEAVDARTDLFSLGLVLWEALAGRRVYEGEDKEDILARARLGDVPPLPDEVPEALREIVRRATACERQARFPDARTMQVALDSFVVRARAADPGSAAPSHRLAAWVAALFPGGDEPSAEERIEVPGGRMVTFLDDGEARVIAEESAGGSAIETAAEEPPPLAAASAPPAPSPRPRRWPWIAAVTGVFAGAAISFALVSRERAVPAPAAPPPAPVVAAVPPPPPDAAPALPDAQPPPKPVVPDAAPSPPPIRKKPMGSIDVETTPWARVQVVGHKEGCTETRCTISLPAGRYVLRLTNADLRKDITVKVEPDKVTHVQEQLVGPAGP